MQRTFFYSGIVMAALFLGCGFVFLCSDFMIDKYPRPSRTWFAIVFLAYGGFRAARQYHQYKKMKADEHE